MFKLLSCLPSFPIFEYHHFRIVILNLFNRKFLLLTKGNIFVSVCGMQKLDDVTVRHCSRIIFLLSLKELFFEGCIILSHLIFLMKI